MPSKLLSKTRLIRDIYLAIQTYSSIGFQRPVGRRSYHNQPRLTGECAYNEQV